MRQNTHHRTQVQSLRREGKSYGEIQKIIGCNIAKSTLSFWCNAIPLTRDYEEKIRVAITAGGVRARAAALAAKKVRREQYLSNLAHTNAPLLVLLSDHNIAKLSLAVLYLAEGGKFKKGSVMFGNSDPSIICLFLDLLRKVYVVDENRFRCTLQCRADQQVEYLESFWSDATRIPRTRFYKARIDPRTVGSRSRKKDYKGVCRIDYFSAEVYNDIMSLCGLLQTQYGPIAQG
jgi:hypothetical protein